jgi:hypothetical protein
MRTPRFASIAIVSAVALLAGPALGAEVVLTSGTSGTTSFFQSFNETRGATVTVLNSADLHLEAMVLKSFNVISTPASLGARVYDESSHALLASQDISVPSGNGQSASVPISATLVSGHSYRVCFFLSADNTGSCTMFDPNPAGFGGIPYTDATGTMRIEGLWDGAADAFPTLASTALPIMALEIGPSCVDLTAGPSGSFSGQSFNETRGMDVVVQGTTDFDLRTMQLEGLNIGSPSAFVGARVYDTDTHALIASADQTVTTGTNQTVIAPVTATLVAGKTYRVCFFADAGGADDSGTLFDPSPPGTGGFPYTEATGNIRVLQSYSTGSDAFPAGLNFFAPHIVLCQTSFVDVPHDERRPGFIVEAVRPNPLLVSGVLEFDLPARSRVVVQQYSVTGERVGRTEAMLDAGHHAMPIASRGRREGMYFLEFRAFAPSGELRYRTSRKVTILAR